MLTSFFRQLLADCVHMKLKVSTGEQKASQKSSKSCPPSPPPHQCIELLFWYQTSSTRGHAFLLVRRELVQLLLLVLSQLAVPVLEISNVLTCGAHEELGKVLLCLIVPHSVGRALSERHQRRV